MAYTLKYTVLPGLVAGADLSAKQFHMGKLASTAGQVVLNATSISAGNYVGVIMNKPYTGEEVEFAVEGIVKMIVATSTIAIGDGIACNTTSKGTDAGTTDNAARIAKAVEASTAANDIITAHLYGAGGVRF
jgi:predicted RecA/RadA family phage recombinase